MELIKFIFIVIFCCTVFFGLGYGLGYNSLINNLVATNSTYIKTEYVDKVYNYYIPCDCKRCFDFNYPEYNDSIEVCKGMFNSTHISEMCRPTKNVTKTNQTGKSVK